MCIIAYRPANATLTDSTLRTMYQHNPDGAGFMYAQDGKLYVFKGYMKMDDYLDAYYAIPADVNLVIHTRIGTAGSNSSGNTHPYPVTDETRLLKSTSLVINRGYAFAHNGILSNLSLAGDYNDSQAFGVLFLAPLARLSKALPLGLQDESVRSIINSAIGMSKIVIMNTTGYVTMYGSGWVYDEGIYYSNTAYKPYTTTYYSTPKYGHAYGSLFGDDFSLKPDGKPKKAAVDGRRLRRFDED